MAPTQLTWGSIFRRLVGRDQRHVETILPTPVVQGLHPIDLVGPGGHDQLTAKLMGDSVLGREAHHRVPTTPTHPGLQAARCVVDAGVDDTGVPSGLMAGQLGLLLEED